MNATKTDQALAVLVGSDDPKFGARVQSIFAGYYTYQLNKFDSIDKALDAAEQLSPGLVIVDGAKGTDYTNEWVQSLKMTYSAPMLVLFSLENPLNISFVKKNGADAVMHLHYDAEFINDMILKLAPTDLKGDSIPLSALMPVDLKDFVVGTEINFEIYVRLPANQKTFLLRRSGSIIEEKTIEKVKSTNQRIYVKKTQLKPFFEYASAMLSMQNSNENMSYTEKVVRAKRNIQNFMSIFLDAAEVGFDQGKTIYESCKQVIEDLGIHRDYTQEQIKNYFREFTGQYRTYYHDAINVCMFSAFFARMLGYPPEKVESIALAGLLHNIGLAEVPPSILNKKVADLTPDEWSEYQKYPQKSVNMVKSKKVPLDTETSNIILQHRELKNGQGFPSKMRGDSILEAARIINIAYHFQTLTALSENNMMLTCDAAMQKLFDDAVAGHNGLDFGLIKRLQQ